MTDFLLKSTLSLILLYAVYIVLLEKEKMHQFNRLFLMFSLIFSLVIPFISFEIYVKTIQTIQQNAVQALPFSVVILEEKTNYLPLFLCSVYGLVTIVLLSRFIVHLIKIQRKIKRHPKQNFHNSTLVLLEENVLPHTFLHYIFINKSEFEKSAIEAELYTHELTHVRQKHTLDILFIEILKTILWFNPILIVYKKAIQLNHEFLADEKVVKSYNNVPFYQKLLLEKASWNNTFYLASNLNFLVTKKRLIMMTKTTSNKMLFLKKIALLPILSGMIYFLCTETVAQNKPQKNSQKELTIDPIKERDYFKNVRFKYYEDSYKDKDGTRRGKLTINKLYEELTASDKEKFKFILIVPNPTQKKSPTKDEFENFKNDKKYAIWIDGKNVPNIELNKYKPTEIASFSGSVILKNARTKKHPQPFQYWFFTNSYFNKNEMGKQKTNYDGTEIAIWGTPVNDKLYQEYLSNIKVTKETKEKQEKDEIDRQSGDYIYNAVEKRPEFPGGIQAFYDFVAKNYKMPDVKDLKGKIFIQFIVEKDGSLSEIETMRDIGHGTGEEAVRVLKLSPNWVPGELDGEKVRVQYSLPISVVGN
jgi:hypothetical protein